MGGSEENLESSQGFQIFSNLGILPSIFAVKYSILRISVIMERAWCTVGALVESQSLGMALFAARRTKDPNLCSDIGIPGNGRPKGNVWGLMG